MMVLEASLVLAKNAELANIIGRGKCISCDSITILVRKERTEHKAVELKLESLIKAKDVESGGGVFRVGLSWLKLAL